MTGRSLESSRVIRFILEVEDIILDLLRGDRRRLIILTVLPVVCYALMAFEVWLVLWAVGEPIGITAALAIETFARVGSVASAFIPANIGALEASNAAPVAMLGLGGGGALALSRRVRATIWALLGLILYPRVKSQRPTPNAQALPTPNSQITSLNVQSLRTSYWTQSSFGLRMWSRERTSRRHRFDRTLSSGVHSPLMHSGRASAFSS